ncbi:unnamed protein product [Lymnaea stagnalis]|uniref:PX domain-containing protein n=1 Tax=Lymnaea stagnalis TaxID=6523 RepID=A0AAV2HH62_LYMST
MPRATVTSRELKNKDSGLDLFVTSFSEQKGIMTSIVHYQVVLVTNLSCFKLPSHKETDVVQYSLDKKLMEFEDLRAKISELFTGTVLPTINKKSMIVNDMVLRERRNSLDQLLKFLASVPKLATCVPLLEFLGVDANRAKNFSPGETFEETSSSSTKEKQGKETPEDSDRDFFQENTDEQEDSELFEEEKGVFEEREERNPTHVQMFEEQDLKRDLTEDDEKDFGFIPDAIITKKETVQVFEDDMSDLFQDDDDLDQLMNLDLRKKKTQQNSQEDLSLPTATTSQTESSPQISPTAPAAAVKPTPPAKPSLPPNKPKLNHPPVNHLPGAEPAGKPALPAKPKPAPRTKLTSQNSDTGGSVGASKPNSALDSQPGTNVSESLDQDDILKYLQDNLSSNKEEVDLFS